MRDEEAKVRHAGTGERIDKQGEPEMRIKVKAAQVTCTVGTESGQCKTGKCISIGEDRVCTDCGKAGEVPINGKCVVSSDPSVTTTAGCAKSNGDLDDQSTTCGKCTKTGYFLYKGGCYDVSKAPGNLICSAIEESAPGMCKTCAPGYFKNPASTGNDATKQSCIACSDETGADSNTGVANCATCDPPKKSGAATCLTCLDGYYNSGSESSVKCTACDNACATCSGDGANKCTSCKEADKYLKTDSSAGISQCVNEAACKQGGTHFPTTDKTSQKKICILCSDASNGGIAGCKTCSKTDTTLKCLTCSDPKKPNKDGTRCFACSVDGCSNCSADGVCEVCNDSKKASPGGSSCVPNCPENSSDQNGVCVCNSGFTPSGDKCTSSSANKSGLSTGAVAGISVAAVAVVGGLVGFLCWWFVCRGKA